MIMEVLASNLSIKCSSCKQMVLASAKNDHQRYHDALKTLKYKPVGKGPRSMEVLLKRRRMIVKKLLLKFKLETSTTDLSARIEKLDEAFDIVRSEMMRGKSTCRTLCPLIEKVRLKDGGLSVDQKDVLEDIKSEYFSSRLPDCVVAIGSSSAMNVQYRDTMEDRTSVIPSFASLENKLTNDVVSTSCYVGMYDGYYGSTAAEQTGQALHNLMHAEIEKERDSPLSNEVKFNLNSENHEEVLMEVDHEGMITDDRNSEDTDQPLSYQSSSASLLSPHRLLKCFKKAYKAMDQELSWGVDEKSRVRWSGCSSTTLLIADEHQEDTNPRDLSNNTSQAAVTADVRSPTGRIFIANAGNVLAYMCHQRKPFRLTQCHTVDNQDECQRVEKVGGRIVGDNKYATVNGLLATTRGLGNHGDLDLKKSVTFEPYTATAPITCETQLVVIATETLWSLFEPSEVFYIINNTKLLDKNYFSLMDDNSSHSDVSIQPHLADAARNPEEDEVFLVDAARQRGGSALPGIVETDEEHHEGIEEVVIVRRKRAEYDDEDDSSMISNQNDAPFNPVSEATDENAVTQPAIENTEELENVTGRLAKQMSEKLVQAAIAGGAKENVSAAVILFPGFFA